MPNYMTVKASSGALPAVTYYRKQREDHASHEESSTFTADAVTTYATANNVAQADVSATSYRSGQGVPQHGTSI